MLTTIKKGISILKADGLTPFIKRFFIFLSHNSFSYGTYYLYDKALIDTNEKILQPKTTDFTLKIIRASPEVDKWIENGFNFGLFQDISAIKELLSKGSILFCVFVKGDWAHSSWVGMDNDSIGDPFFKKTAQVGAGVIGPCATNSAYRGLGFYPYVLTHICEFLKKNGRSNAVISTAKNNLASGKGIMKVGFTVFSEGYHVCILGWSIWKKKLL